jgi:FkbM family methyltransferase
MVTFSDFGQDRWVVDEVFGPDLAQGYKGFFIEAGAATGVDASNTYLLETQYGWTGLLVEPNEYFFQHLCRHRRAHCARAVLSDKDGEIEFIEAGYLGVAPDHVRSVFEAQGLDLYGHGSYQSDANGTPATRSMLPARTLRTLLAEIGAPSLIDYFSLDVEGGELAVLQGFPFETHKIRALTIETRFSHNGVMFDHAHREPCRALLESHGMRLAKTVSVDDFYVAD